MMLSVEEARAAMLHAFRAPANAERAALDDALGSTLAEPIFAPRDQPPFDVSAMDGYALRGAETPARLRILGESAAGRPFDAPLPVGAAVRISTGARVPDGADSVLIQEDAIVEGEWLDTPLVRPRAHVRPRAGDFAKGETLLSTGQRLDAGTLTLAAAAGRAALLVAAKPRIAILASGDEIRAPGAPIGDAQIYESASFGVAALARAWGADVERRGIVADDEGTLSAAAAVALSACDLLVVIGGASVGPHDHGRAALQALGFSLHVEKVSVRPGKPTWFATGPGGAVLGLPGNPASALVCARLFLAPLIVKALGGAAEAACTLKSAPLAHALPANGPREHYVRAR
ncbi:MAG: molybdopterin molybdotransferase MoeA, partial [Hyphomonadaceae bacterium]